MTHRIDRIGKFEITEPLGQGSLGEAFLARDTIIGREVVLKVIRRSALPPPDPEARFLRECQAASRLNHPNLVTIHEFGEKGGTLYLVQDYLPGSDLETMLQEGALTPKEVLDLLAQLCDGLAYLHQRAILHRNLKPVNIRMSRVAGRPAPKLMDGGFTTAITDPAGAAAHLATLRYTAPECLHAGKPDGRADLFPLGVILYEALTGVRPFDGPTPAAVTKRLREEEPPDLDPALFPDLSPALAGVARQALAKDPARRYPTAEALGEALRAVRNPSWTPQRDAPWSLQSGKVLPVPPRKRADHPRRSRAWIAWVAVLLVVALGAGGGVWFWSRHRRRTPTPPPLPVTVPSPLQLAPAASAPAPAPGSQPGAAAAQPAPAPAAAPAPAKPKYATLDEAVAAVAPDPEGALAFLDQALAARPDDERILANRIVALYNLKRYQDAGKAIREAREAGHQLWAMAQHQPALRHMLEQDSKDPHLPRRKAPASEPAAAP